MLKTFLYAIVEEIAKIHSKILSWNDAYEMHFSDKELHFIVIGILGMLMVLVIHPLFQWLAMKKQVLVITWIYVFTLIIVITFAIEIGQSVTHSGAMEFADIMFGLVGFLAMFGAFAIFRGIFVSIYKFFKRTKKDTN